MAGFPSHRLIEAAVRGLFLLACIRFLTSARKPGGWFPPPRYIMGKDRETAQNPMREYLAKRERLSAPQWLLVDRYSFAKTAAARAALADTLQKGLAVKLGKIERARVKRLIQALRVSAERHRAKTEQTDERIREVVLRSEPQVAKPKKKSPLRDNPAFRKTAQENQWKTRRERGLSFRTNIADFIQTVYGQWIEVGMTQADLHAVDTGAYAALYNYTRIHNTSPFPQSSDAMQ